MRRLLIVLALAACSEPALAEPIEFRFSGEDLSSLYALAYGHAGIGVPDQAPHFYPVTRATLAQLVCGKVECDALAVQVADSIFYFHQMPRDDPVAMSILVHELVHYAQWRLHGTAKSCEERMARERVAYRVQAEVLDRVNVRLPVPDLPRCI